MKVDNKVKVTYLGTGTSQGVPVIGCTCDVCRSENSKDKRLRSSALVKSNGKNILIDAGPDFRQQMLRANVKHLDAILLTHEHADHILGLDDIRAFNHIQHKPIDIYCERRVEDSVKRIFNYVFKKDKYPGIPEMNVITIEEKSFYIDDLLITPIRCYHHKLPILGFRIHDFTYITDSKRIDAAELDKIKDSNVLTLNALQFREHLSHFTVHEAIEVAQSVNAKTTYFTHASHSLGKYEDVQKMLPPTINLAYDGLTVFS